jgi:hypothetical protein
MAMLKRRTVIQASLAAALVAAVAIGSEIATWDMGIGPIDAAGWRPIAWPFPSDDHTTGRAWRGHDLEVYVRPKIGACGNGVDGVATDEEVDRITDIALFDKDFTPLGEGRRIRVTDLFGRTRFYRVKAQDGSTREVQAIAVAHNCDLVVAVVVGNVRDEAQRKKAHRFIESNTVQVWVLEVLERK